MGMFLKDPAASLDYAVDWSAAYLDGATVVTSDWRVEPAGVAVVATVATPGRTAVTLAGGVPGEIYRIANRVLLSDGRRDERTLILRVEDR